MKIILALSLLVFCLCLGCDGMDVGNCQEHVRDFFPGSEVIQAPGHNYDFIVRAEDGVVWYVECHNTSNTDITSKRLLFRSRR